MLFFIYNFNLNGQKIIIYYILKLFLFGINGKFIKNISINSHKFMHIYAPCTFPKPFFQTVSYSNLITSQPFGIEVNFNFILY